MEPLDITNIRDESEKNMRLSNDFIEDVADKEILNIIDEHLDVVFRADYLRIRDGTYVPKPRREQIIKELLFIRLNLSHHLINLITQINLTVLPRQLRKTAPLRQQAALR